MLLVNEYKSKLINALNNVIIVFVLLRFKYTKKLATKKFDISLDIILSKVLEFYLNIGLM